MVAEQTAPVLAGLRLAVADLQDAKQQWLSHWEAGAVRLATRIAARVIRREVRAQPEITLALVREALELAAGSPTVRVHLNPKDYKLLGAGPRDDRRDVGPGRRRSGLGRGDRAGRLARGNPLRHDRPADRVAIGPN